MNHLLIILTAVVSLVSGGMAGPESADAQPGPLRLTLADAVDRGLGASHRLAEFRAREAGARASVDGRHAALRPLLSAQAGFTRTNHVDEFAVRVPGGPIQVVYPDLPNNYRTRLDLQWPIFTFGRTEALERMARAELDATGQDLDAARNDLRLEITRAFWALVTANESVRVVGESVKRMDASLEDVRNRLNVGLIPPNDVLSVEAQRSRQQMLLIQARNTRELAAADLRRLVGLAPDTPVDLDATLEEPGAAIPDAETLVAEARKARPERQALATRVGEAATRRQVAEAGTKPTIAVAGGGDYSRPNSRIFPRVADWKNSWDASVNLNWLLWDGGRVRADIADAAAGQLALEERLAEFDSQLELEVRQRRLDVESARATIAAAVDAVRSASEARRVVGERFAAGVAISTDVLDAQVTLLQVELDRTEALARAKLAEARLDRAIGR
jgi:outer membrane protein